MSNFLPRYRRHLSMGQNFANLSGCAKLVLGAIILGLLLLICILISHLMSSTKSDPKGPEICTTPACHAMSQFLLEHMDQKTSPCDDFYQYACGQWNEAQVIPDDRPMKTTFSDAADTLNEKLKLLLETREPEEPTFIRNLRNYYASCMDTSKLDLLGSKPLLDLIEKLGGYPVLGGKPAPFSWSDQLVKLRQYGLNSMAFFKVMVMPDIAQNTKNIIVIDQVDLGVSDRSALLKGLESPIVQAYYELLIKSSVLLGATEEVAKTQMLEVLKFEIELARNSRSRSQETNLVEWYNKKSLAQLKELAPNTPWAKMLAAIVTYPDSTVPFDQNEPVIVTEPENLAKIDKLISETPSETLANYLMSRVVLKSMSSLNAEWRQLAHLYASGASSGAAEPEERWRTCLNLISSSKLSTSLSALYVRNSFEPEQRAYAQEMVTQLRDEFTNRLQAADWLDDATRQTALAKTTAMLQFVAYPDELLDENTMNDYYKTLEELKQDEMFESSLALWKLDEDLEYGRLRLANDRKDWRQHARLAVINAFYNILENSIDIPAGILQAPFFNHLNPAYANFGSIGQIIGHEITHGFDSSGREFDATGQFSSWWTPETGANFLARAECFVKQYANFSVPEVDGAKVDGSRTLGENIADNGGLKSAFYAYQNYRAKRADLGRLPGLEGLSEDELFWISSASAWCGKLRPEYLAEQLARDSHAPARFRVNGPAMNSDEFAAVFKCPLGSPMNPASKCAVW